MIIEVATVMKRTHRAVDRYLIVVCRLEALGLGAKDRRYGSLPNNADLSGTYRMSRQRGLDSR